MGTSDGEVALKNMLRKFNCEAQRYCIYHWNSITVKPMKTVLATNKREGGDPNEIRNIFRFMKSIPYLQQKSWESALSQIQKEINLHEGPLTKLKMQEVYESFEKRARRDWDLLNWHGLPELRNDMSNNTNERINKNHKSYLNECNAIRSIDILNRTREWLQCRSMDHRRVGTDSRSRHESHVSKKIAIFAFAAETLSIKKLFQKIIELDF